MCNSKGGKATKQLVGKIKSDPNLADKLGWGWIKLVGELAATPDEKGPFADVDALVTAVAVVKPPPSEKKKANNERKKELKRKHYENMANVDDDKANKGKRMRTVSFHGTQKYNDHYFQTTVHQTNVTDLESTFHPTPGGQVHDLRTGNASQSMLAAYRANLPGNAQGVSLEGVWHRMKAVGQPPPVRTTPFTAVEKHLRVMTANDEGSYKTGVASDSVALEMLEMTRLPENNIPTQMRSAMVTGNLLTRELEHDPVGKYALQEVPGATKPTDNLNRLVNQNSWNIYQQALTLPTTTVLGVNTSLLPHNTNLATIGSFQTAMNNYDNNPSQQTQNDLTRQGFYVQRGNVGYHINTPPGSPFDPNRY